MKYLYELLYNIINQTSIADQYHAKITIWSLFILFIIGLVLIDFVLRKFIITTFKTISQKTTTRFDNIVFENRVPHRLAHIVPVILLLQNLPFLLQDSPTTLNFCIKTVKIIGIILSIQIIKSCLKSAKDYLKTLPQYQDKPLNSYIQVVLIVVWIISLMSIVVVITDTPILKFFTALGALSAVFLLVFKDTILGFVASIQISINDMVRIGDWITFQKFNADGDVIEITLATVKVQNFDKTITTIPTYALISESFKNWRGVKNAGGRRIKRAIHIKQQSISFLKKEDIDNLAYIKLIHDYLVKKQAEIQQYNEKYVPNDDTLINGRSQTNIGIFRKYIELYLEHHKDINQEMTIIVRQLAPSSNGLPVEIYAFSSDKEWKKYEHVISDIFDHLLATIPYFNLEVHEQFVVAK